MKPALKFRTLLAAALLAASLTGCVDALTAILIARTAEDRKVEIKVSKTGDQSAKVQIRVGFFGDEALSLTVLDKIKTNL